MHAISRLLGFCGNIGNTPSQAAITRRSITIYRLEKANSNEHEECSDKTFTYPSEVRPRNRPLVTPTVSHRTFCAITGYLHSRSSNVLHCEVLMRSILGSIGFYCMSTSLVQHSTARPFSHRYRSSSALRGPMRSIALIFPHKIQHCYLEKTNLDKLR
jgi:hypothetical protein